MSLAEYETMRSTRVSEIDNQANEDIKFNPSDFFIHLGSVRDDFILIYSSILDSTQEFVKSYCSGLPNVVCCADVQTNGKGSSFVHPCCLFIGRSSNVWVSPPGCLMFSFNCSMQNGQFVNMIQYLEALVMCKTLREIPYANDLAINIKWPNDLFLDKRHELCGILCYSEFCDGMFNITSGIGINVSNRSPTVCLEEKIRELTGKVTTISRYVFLHLF